ncbi:MAG: hypothetical protein PHU71_01155 [Candidatus Gracilibacteria bacterium]|nr:hypothetical protein [Candidatus Gracilibacteria bacterium]
MRKTLLLTLTVFLILLTACEREGIVNDSALDDCMEVITTKDGSLISMFHTFTCTYDRTESEKIRSGVCVSLDINDGVCRKAYMYEKEPYKNCGENRKLSYSDECLCVDYYEEYEGECISMDKYCPLVYGEGSIEDYQNYKWGCICDVGYDFDAELGKCISKQEKADNYCITDLGDGAFAIQIDSKYGNPWCGCKDGYAIDIKEDGAYCKELATGENDVYCSEKYGSEWKLVEGGYCACSYESLFDTYNYPSTCLSDETRKEIVESIKEEFLSVSDYWDRDTILVGITDVISAYASGKIGTEEMRYLATWQAVKTNEGWKLLNHGNSDHDCVPLEPYDFPKSMFYCMYFN